MNSLQQDSRKLANFLRQHPKLVVLTGAGISRDSGIPTYRDEHGLWQHQAPIQEQAFLQCEQTRRRYWRRSWYGWPLLRDARPNAAHIALNELERRGHIALLITQNVDRLHQRAGSANVVDLHGRVDQVRCLVCARRHDRESIQRLLAQENHWQAPTQQTPRPDGDMQIFEAHSSPLVLPRCHYCAGDLMPDVVFFGGSVPVARVSACLSTVASADALLVIGSSLMVYSGFRFCRRASQLGKPIAIINPGVTRADPLAQLKLHTPATALLTQTLAHMDREY